MKFNLKHLLTSLTGTIILLLFFEILSTSFLPALGLENYRIAIDVLIILYLGFRLDTPFLALLWFVITSLLFYLHTKSLSFIELRLWHFIPESLLLSLFSPVIFTVLDKFWSKNYQTEAGI